MSSSTFDDSVWLVSAAAQPFLEAAWSAFQEKTSILTIVKRLRKNGVSPNRAALILELVQLRVRAKKKFSLAEQLFFSRRGYEQSTGELLARYKRDRFDGVARVADICCGIGGDLMELAKREQAESTVGIDNDPLCCCFARKNLEIAECKTTDVHPANFHHIDLTAFNAVHIDPDRRVNRRTVVGDQFEPKLSEVIERLGPMDGWAIKVAPATRDDSSVPEDAEIEWIGDGRECKQQVIWHGCLTKTPGQRTATMVGRDGTPHCYSVAAHELLPGLPPAASIGQYVYEPHASILASKLTDFLAAEHELSRLSSEIAYLTSDQLRLVPMTKTYSVEQVLPFNLRQVSAELRRLNVGRLDIKQRGIAKHDAAQFEKLKLVGDESACIVLTRHQRKRIVLLVKRIRRSAIKATLAGPE